MTMSKNKMSAKIPHFDCQNYDHWSDLIENLLHAKDMWSSVENGFEEPSEATALSEAQLNKLEKEKLDDHKVKHYIFRAIDRSIFKQVLDRRTSKCLGFPEKQIKEKCSCEEITS